MSPRQVSYFLAVADELHFGRAAERLHIAQPSLSQQIRRLEAELGVALFARTSRRVELTPAGEVLVREGRRLLTHGQRVIDATRSAGADTLTVGFYGTAGSLLPEILRAFTSEHPLVQVTLRELLFGTLEDLIAHRVDLAFTRLRPGHGTAQQDELELEILATEPRLLVVASAHRLAGRDRVCASELGEEAFVVNPAVRGVPATRWLAEQRRHGLPGRVAAEAGSVQELLTAVAAGRGVAFVPETVSRRHPREDLSFVPVGDIEPAVISLAWPPGRRRAVELAFAASARLIASRS